jgi:hypothetical protein
VSDKQYGYRFYDSRSCVGPFSRDEVLDKMRSDMATIPVERHFLFEGIWSDWFESDELIWEV